MSQPLYLALTDGTTTVNLTDTTKYNIRGPNTGPEWMPAIAFPIGNTVPDVVETIPIEVIGSSAAEVAANLADILNILAQAGRFANSEHVRAVTLVQTMPGSRPAKRLSRLIIGGVGGNLPGNFYHTVNMINSVQITITVTVTGEFLHTSWVNDQLYNVGVNPSYWDASPGWTASAGVLGYVAGTTPDGNAGYLSHSNANLNPFLTSTNTIAFNSLGSYTVLMRVAAAREINITVVPRNSADGAAIGSGTLVSVTPAGTSVLDEDTSTVVAIPFTITTTDAGGRLRVTLAVPSGIATVVQLTDVLVVAGTVGADDDRWHLAYDEHTITDDGLGVGYTLNPAVVTFSGYDAPAAVDLPSPTDIELDFGDTGNVLNAAYLLISSEDASDSNLLIQDWTSAIAAPWTTVADAANLPLGGTNVRRFTPLSTAEVTQSVDIGSSVPARQWRGPVLAFILARNNSATQSFTAKIQCKNEAGIVIAETPPITIPAGATSPTWYPVGIAVTDAGDEVAAGMYGINLVASVSAITGGPTLDVDAFAFLRLVPGAIAIATNTVSQTGINSANYLHRALSSLSPAVVHDVVSTTLSRTYIPYTSSPFIRTRGRYLHYAWLSTSNGRWAHVNSGATSTKSGVRALMRRTPSSIAPV